eukprot:scaffold8397_cov90-Cylindrotheca_fusiformis.AAC.6
MGIGATATPKFPRMMRGCLVPLPVLIGWESKRTKKKGAEFKIQEKLRIMRIDSCCHKANLQSNITKQATLVQDKENKHYKMEGLRQSLIGPAASSFMLSMGSLYAIVVNIKHRHMAKDDDGKELLPHPYSPWEIPPDSKHKAMADKAWRAFKIAENIQENTVLSLPLVWIMGIFGTSTCPSHVTDKMVSTFLVSSTCIYTYANYKYIHGYVESPEKRLGGFFLRMKVFMAWTLLSGASIVGYVLRENGMIGSQKRLTK